MMNNSNCSQSPFQAAFFVWSLLILVSCAGKISSEANDSAGPESAKIEPESKISSEASKPDSSETDSNEIDSDCKSESCEQFVGILIPECSGLELPNAAPKTIQEFTDFVNKLPKPTTVNCVVEALQRPLTISATSNRFSAQGATGSTSPRIFIEKGNLIMTFVPGGPERHNIELAETTSSDQSIKGDLKFPITDPLIEQSAFMSIFGGGEPACANLCHTDYLKLKEFKDGSVKYSSNRIFPKENSVVQLIEMELFREDCESVGSNICNFYRSLFDHGEVNKFVFPSSVNTGGLPF